MSDILATIAFALYLTAGIFFAEWTKGTHQARTDGARIILYYATMLFWPFFIAFPFLSGLLGLSTRRK